MRFLTVDPGERTFAWSITDLEIKRGALIFKHAHSAYLQAPIVNLTHNDGQKIGQYEHRPLEVELGWYCKELDAILRQHRPQRIGTERYQARGPKGKTIESVSMMNGILLARASSKRIPYRLYTAGTWKLWVNRLTDLEQLYKIGKVRNLLPHTIDTVMTALWMFLQEFPEHKALLTESVLENAVRNSRLSE